MRIIAGRYKGRRLKTPTWAGLRPTSDQLRETLFNIVAARVPGARVLDGFAGTGAIGIEALSRGAAHVTFVERDRRAVRLIADNLRSCGAEAVYTIEGGDVATVLGQDAAGGRFDLVLLDPPYEMADLGAALAAAALRLAPDGLLVLERSSRREVTPPPGLQRTRDVRAGDSTLTFFIRS